MFGKIKSLVSSSKDNNIAVDKVKKQTQTADSIISQAVTNAGNISNVTLSKEERKALLDQRKKVPAHILIMKFTSLGLFAILLVATLFLKADLHPENAYFGLLGLNDNTGSLHKKVKVENTELQDEIEEVETKIETQRTKIETEKYGIFTEEIDEITAQQKNWFTKTEVVTNIETGETETKTTYGLIDSFGDMISYFQDANYQTKFFAKREKDLLGSNWEMCKNPFVPSAKKAELKCPPPIMIAMKNEIEIKSYNINPTGASISVSASEILSKIFTLGSEFVDMMNSFPFYKNGEVRSFTRREQANGEESIELSIRLEFQEEPLEGEEGEVDPADEYFQYFENWNRLNKAINAALSQSAQSSQSSPSSSTTTPRTTSSN